MTAALADRPFGSTVCVPHAPEWEQVSELVLAALPSAISCARLLVHSALSIWQFDRRCRRVAEQAVDELVAHAVATTGVTEAQPMYREAFNCLGLLRVQLRLRPEALAVEVWDSGTSPPDPHLCRSLSTNRQWGYDLPSPGKRVVWCVVPASPEMHHDGQLALPRRVPRPIPRPEAVAPAEAMRDPDVLQRVLDGLRGLDRTTDQEKSC